MAQKLVIRKISIGVDYRNAGMHFVKDQRLPVGRITAIEDAGEAYALYVQPEDKTETVLWKTFSKTLPLVIEYDLNV